MRVLLFGANGQVGRACQELMAGPEFELLPITRREADLSNPAEAYEAVVSREPQLVINASAYTAVDKAESEPELAQSVNGDSVAAMGKACAKVDIPLIHISTDYVFDGQGSKPYKEEDPVNPMGVYGATKLAGEQALEAGSNKVVILRSSWVFGEYGSNFVKTMLRLGASRPELGVVSDQVGKPTYATDIASVILSLTRIYRDTGDLPWGIYHCSNQGTCSWYDFACEIFNQAESQGFLESSPAVKPITTGQYPTPAARPAYSVLDCSKLERLLGAPLSHWQVGLERMLSHLAASAWLGESK
ncbi:dTDP-4-dehydrorhamnose reductase [Microbulbifer aggregans]|uniref:dTDP-4-dehydrorhamnose reductase n=1 Tax=Microbulbifer aggregans TaxID=1769779 RepID=A0A1C9W7T0_9GAMM|nr:dTDP-4-dehydrorhamnose reductase [Microbulbifer aggregans]AOS97193.1 dTDP-4-dehydrorhamnose reductase [Microbulbifer aggregans]